MTAYCMTNRLRNLHAIATNAIQVSAWYDHVGRPCRIRMFFKKNISDVHSRIPWPDLFHICPLVLPSQNNTGTQEQVFFLRKQDDFFFFMDLHAQMPEI